MIGIQFLTKLVLWWQESIFLRWRECTLLNGYISSDFAIEGNENSPYSEIISDLTYLEKVGYTSGKVFKGIDWLNWYRSIVSDGFLPMDVKEVK